MTPMYLPGAAADEFPPCFAEFAAARAKGIAKARAISAGATNGAKVAPERIGVMTVSPQGTPQPGPLDSSDLQIIGPHERGRCGSLRGLIEHSCGADAQATRASSGYPQPVPAEEALYSGPCDLSEETLAGILNAPSQASRCPTPRF